MEYIEIDKDLIPYRFDITLADETFTFEVQYNADFDFFTVDLERDGEILVVGEKLIYGVPLFTDVWDNRFPGVAVMPYDESGQSTVVNWDTLSVSVFLFILDGEEDGE